MVGKKAHSTWRFLRRHKVWAVYLPASLIGVALVALGVLRYGDPQWHRSIYIFQVYTWPRGGDAERPLVAGTLTDADKSGVRPSASFSGIWVDWDRFGHKIGETSYENGITHGKCVLYRGDGEKFAEETYQNGVLHGKMTIWGHGPGSKSLEHSMANGKLDGKTTWWDDKGNVIAEGVYKMARSWNASFVETVGGPPCVVNEYKEGELWNGRRPVDHWNPKGLVQIVKNGVVVGTEPNKVVQSVGGSTKAGKPWNGRFHMWDNDRKRFVINTLRYGVLLANESSPPAN